MARRRRWLIVLGAILLVGAATVLLLRVRRPRGGLEFVTYPAAEAAGARNPHAFRGRPLCQACHAGEREALQDDGVRLCQRCHTFHKSHPVLVRHKRGRPAELPLDPEGRVVCHTCHDPHDLKRLKGGLRLPFNTLCQRCHPAH